MTWKPIVAGVDLSAEGTRAAVVAARLAQSAKTDCYLVHAARDPWTEASLAQIPTDLSELNRVVLDSARAQLKSSLAAKVADPVFDRLDVRLGSPPVVLNEVVVERGAELLVLGGKHHSALGRWLGGSTVHHMVRTTDLPVLVVGPSEGKFRRVLVAVDLSSAARPTLHAAERLAELSGGELRVIHVVEPLPMLADLPLGLEEIDVVRRAEEELERSVWPLLARPDTERLVRQGPAADTLAQAVQEWSADLLVVGSHGKGWVDRVLIGSTTERLLNQLPAAVLVVPVSPTGQGPGRRQPTAAKRRGRRPAGTAERSGS